MDLKSEILRRLEERRGEYISGEKLSAELTVTRQAVNKAVKKLNEEGYDIRSVTNRGYMLDGKCDLLSSSVISAKTGVKVYVYDVVSSTNTVAKSRFCVDGECVVVAESQSAGRKKNGSEFISPERKGIYMSVALPVDMPLDKGESFRSACAEAVAACICNACGQKPQIRDVDEIYLNGRKACGILVECEINLATKRIFSAVVGVGIYTADTDGQLGYITSAETRNSLVAEVYAGIKKAALHSSGK